MPINFPSSPTANLSYTFGNRTWVYNGYGWKSQGGNTTVTSGASSAFTYANTAPTSNTVGDQWVDSSSGVRYQYINDGDSYQWIEFGGYYDYTLNTYATVSYVNNQFANASANITALSNNAASNAYVQATYATTAALANATSRGLVFTFSRIFE
jgi:hypothetical protein